MFAKRIRRLTENLAKSDVLSRWVACFTIWNVFIVWSISSTIWEIHRQSLYIILTTSVDLISIYFYKDILMQKILAWPRESQQAGEKSITYLTTLFFGILHLCMIIFLICVFSDVGWIFMSLYLTRLVSVGFCYYKLFSKVKNEYELDLETY